MLKHEDIAQGRPEVLFGGLSTKRRRIHGAIETLRNSGVPVSGLSDTELYARVAQQLKAQGYLPHEIPSLSTFRRHIEQYPITDRVAGGHGQA